MTASTPHHALSIIVITLYHNVIHADTPLEMSDFKDIYEALFDARTKWQDIGLELGVDPETLRSIRREQREYNDDCLKEMLHFRLKYMYPKTMFPSAITWQLIIESLRAKAVYRHDVANEIERKVK